MHYLFIVKNSFNVKYFFKGNGQNSRIFRRPLTKLAHLALTKLAQKRIDKTPAFCAFDKSRASGTLTKLAHGNYEADISNYS